MLKVQDKFNFDMMPAAWTDLESIEIYQNYYRRWCAGCYLRFSWKAVLVFFRGKLSVYHWKTSYGSCWCLFTFWGNVKHRKPTRPDGRQDHGGHIKHIVYMYVYLSYLRFWTRVFQIMHFYQGNDNNCTDGQLPVDTLGTVRVRVTTFVDSFASRYIMAFVLKDIPRILDYGEILLLFLYMYVGWILRSHKNAEGR